MNKLKEILKEKSTWTLGVPSLIIGIGTLVKADNLQPVTELVSGAGKNYAETGDWKTALGWLVAGSLGIFMKGR